jgi:predicted 2-oxoglutarate/Fe(II)-dependent dioxygenase YbiX
MPNPIHLRNLKDYIIVFDNIVPDDLCDRIVNEYNTSNIWNSALVGNGVVDKTIRDVDSVPVSMPQIIDQNFSVRKALDNEIFQCAGVSIQQYNKLFPDAQIQEDSGYELLKYDKGQKYIQHTDSFKDKNRAVSCSFMLNDDFEGGEFAFFNRELKYKLSKGSVLMFPSNFMFPHEVMPVTKGTRYSIITWFV